MLLPILTRITGVPALLLMWTDGATATPAAIGSIFARSGYGVIGSKIIRSDHHAG